MSLQSLNIQENPLIQDKDITINKIESRDITLKYDLMVNRQGNLFKNQIRLFVVLKEQLLQFLSMR